MAVENPLITALLDSVEPKQLLQNLLIKLKKDGLGVDELIEIFQETTGELSIPLSIFSSELPPMEALCKYLIDYEQLSNKNAANLLNRNSKSIWANYQRAKGKELVLSGNQKYLIPISILNNRSFSLLESVILHLNQTYGLTNAQIANLLRKSPNSIAVLLKRAKRKKKKKNEK